MTRLPADRREEDEVKKRLPVRQPTVTHRADLLRIWDALSDDGRKTLLAFAVVVAKKEGRPEVAEPLIKTGKR